MQNRFYHSELNPFTGVIVYTYGKVFLPAATTSTVDTDSVLNTETCSLKSQATLNFNFLDLLFALFWGTFFIVTGMPSSKVTVSEVLSPAHLWSVMSFVSVPI